MAYLLGIDLGTSSVKVALFDAHTLNVAAVCTVEYPVYHPQAGFAEQSPVDWWSATVEAVRDVLQGADTTDVISIGLSGQMHGFVPLDAQLNPLKNCIIWADTRSTEQVKTLKAQQAMFSSTMPGLPAVGFAASSALWLKTHQPEVLAQMHKWCLPKDTISLKLTGNLATEPSDAASSWLFDITTSDWAADVYQFCGLRAEQMPALIESSGVVGELTSDAAAELGLSSGIPVVAGSADLPAQALGQGIASPDTALIIVGTGGQIFVPTHTPTVDDDYRYYLLNHNLANTWYVQAAILSGGLSLRWLRDLLGLAEAPNAYQRLSEMAASVPRGADGVLFLPYLAGERSPHMDSQASGVFMGLRLHHGAEHLARAIMEGVAFAIRDCLRYIPTQLEQQYVLSGGITQSPVWTQILADILELPLAVADDESSYGAAGAAILAGLGAGHYHSMDDVLSIQKFQRQVIRPQASELYRERFQQYLRLYPLLKDEMHQLYS